MIPRETIGDAIDLNGSFSNKLYLSLVPENILDHWSKISDVANFIADFYYHDIPDKHAHNTISTVLNELIENAVKFSHISSFPIDIYTYRSESDFIFQISNTVSENSITELTGLGGSLFSGNLEELYVERIQNLYHKKSRTGIGLILLKKDYKMNMNFRFSLIKSHMSVTVTAKLKVA